MLDVPQTITATLYGRGMAGRSTLVKLSDEAVTVASTVINWKENSESITAPLLVAPRVEGLHRYAVKAEPVEGELNTENNEASFSLDVRRGERKILFIENQPTWEGKFIRRALEENASIAVDYFAEVSRDAVLNQQQSGIERNMHSVLGDFKQLARYDCDHRWPDGCFDDFRARGAKHQSVCRAARGRLCHFGRQRFQRLDSFRFVAPR